MFDSVRAQIRDELDLPAEWRVVDEQRLPTVIDRETVVIKHSAVTKLREAPLGHLEHEVILAVFVPNKDIALAEDRLDKAVTALLTALDGHSWLKWTRAEKVVTPDGQYPGWEIELTAITQIIAPEPPTPPAPPTPESE